MTGDPRDMSPSRLGLGEWPMWARVSTTLMAFVAFAAAPVLASMVVGSVENTGSRVFIEKLLWLVVPMGLMLAVSRPVGPKSLGIAWPGWRPILVWAVGGAVVLNVISVIWDRAHDSEPMGKQLSALGFGGSLSGDILLILAITVLGPVAEEIIFRGMLHRGARDAVRGFVSAPIAIAVATVISTWAFVSIHGDPSQTSMAPVYVAYGLVTAIAYEMTGSLVGPVLLHSATNAFAVFTGALDGSGSGLVTNWSLALVLAAPLLALLLTHAVGRLLAPLGGER